MAGFSLSTLHDRIFRPLIRRPDMVFLCLGIVILAWHMVGTPERIQQLYPVTVQQFNVAMLFDAGGREVEISTFVPENSPRQTVVEQSIQSSQLDYYLEPETGGLRALWSGEAPSNKVKLSYNASLIIHAVNFSIDPDILLPTQYNAAYSDQLKATKDVQVNDPEIKALWQTLAPTSNRVIDTLHAIYQFTHDELESVPFKGTTDALTALRLRQASCNGKSRLFVALARLNHLPARLVGGVILDAREKKTSHQWVEVRVGEYWVPFDPTNGHFASLPDNYLELYRGDHVLFRRTSNINFDYRFSSSSRQIPAGTQAAIMSPDSADRFNTVALLAALGLDEQTAGIFLLFPFCALCISFFRNVIGVKTFGVFMPMLVAAACRYTGLLLGVVAFMSILAVAFTVYRVLERGRMLKVPRLAAVITVVTVFFLVVIALLDVTHSPIQLGIIALFPVVIISFTAERLHHMAEDGVLADIVTHTLGTLALIAVCYFAFDSLLLRGIFASYPESYLLVFAAQLAIGRWMGIRVSELWRFHRILRGVYQSGLLGINKRNRDFVMMDNTNDLIRLANDKLAAKTALSAQGVVVPETLASYNSVLTCQSLTSDIQQWDRFVVKPNTGSRGRGILVLDGRSEFGWLTTNKSELSEGDIYRHVQEILQGSFSVDGQPDIAFIEPLLVTDDRLTVPGELSNVEDFNQGLCDIRVILHHGEIVAAMLRIPTNASGGKANLHQGAIGAAIDLSSGCTYRAEHNGQPVTHHPDTGRALDTIKIPHWPTVLRMAKDCYRAIPLGYLGCDICIDKVLGPLVLEVNARPGLEIQNIHNRGLMDLLQQVRVDLTS
ncbi:sugar-transfer associated ATP-grasp domain-containing protein [Aurantivibrio plasticivorans]